MIAFARTDTSLVARWWWTVDRVTLLLILLLILAGIVLTMSASPAVANRIGAPTYHFVIRQAIFVIPAILAMVGLSLLTPEQVRSVGAMGFGLFFVLLALVPVAGTEIKGARQWIGVGPIALQPSEFIRPFFCIIVAWALADARIRRNALGYLITVVALLGVVGLIVMQPDFGMTMLVAGTWAVQVFVAGLPWLLVAIVLGGAVAGVAGGYLMLDHVASRIDRFLDPSTGDSYQITTSLSAIQNGGLIGRGPGEGLVKAVLPDAHTDFIFSVTAEEFGVLACLLMISAFAGIIIRGYMRMMQERDLFVVLAVSGLLGSFGLQAFINMGVAVHLMPTTGMTLPLISYGGSSLVATACGLGMMLALTRRRYVEGSGR